MYNFRLGFICPQYCNPADFFIEKLGVDTSKAKESREAINVKQV
jgi:hypothetical protein